MGDRGNIVVIANRGDTKRPTYLYTHWQGDTIEQVVDTALAGKGANRLGDEGYLTRIIFDELTKNQTGGETGFGIGPFMDDNEAGRPVIVVDGRDGKVYRVPEGVAQNPDKLVAEYTNYLRE